MIPSLQTLYQPDYYEGMAGIMAFFIFLMLFFALLLVVSYIYFSLTLMTVAKRLKTQNPWLAWIPVANLYLKSQVAKMHWWPLLLLVLAGIFYVPMVIGSLAVNQILYWAGFSGYMISILAFSVFTITWDYRICKRRSRPGWWALLQLLPIALMPLIMIPALSAIFIIPYLLIAFGLGIWAFVMWGILAWSKH